MANFFSQTKVICLVSLKKHEDPYDTKKSHKKINELSLMYYFLVLIP